MRCACVMAVVEAGVRDDLLRRRQLVVRREPGPAREAPAVEARDAGGILRAQPGRVGAHVCGGRPARRPSGGTRRRSGSPRARTAQAPRPSPSAYGDATARRAPRRARHAGAAPRCQVRNNGVWPARCGSDPSAAPWTPELRQSGSSMATTLSISAKLSLHVSRNPSRRYHSYCSAILPGDVSM